MFVSFNFLSFYLSFRIRIFSSMIASRLSRQLSCLSKQHLLSLKIKLLRNTRLPQRRFYVDISPEVVKEFNENGVVCLREVFDEKWLKLCEKGKASQSFIQSVHYFEVLVNLKCPLILSVIQMVYKIFRRIATDVENK